MPRHLGLAAGIALLVLALLPISGALAYGKQDQPLAQLEFSGNCNNPDYWFCSQVVGTGGIWFWVEIDANGTGDMAGAECGHTVGGAGGPGGAGAGSIQGEITWTYWDASSGTPLPPGTLIVGTNLGSPPPTSGLYYLVSLGSGETFAFPVQQGHYSFQPAPGVTLQAQVAP